MIRVPMISRVPIVKLSPGIDRLGFSTVELLVSLSIASVLTLGLTGSILIASKSLELPQQPSATKTLIDAPLGRLRDSIADATQITLQDETIELICNGDAGNTSTNYRLEDGEFFETNHSNNKRLIFSDVETIELSQQINSVPDTGFIQVDFEGAVVASEGGKRRLTLTYPAGCVSGDLLVLLIGYDGSSLLPPSAGRGWVIINLRYGNNQNIVTWLRRFASSSEQSVSIDSIPGNKSIACLIRISKSDAWNPFMSSNGSTGRFDGTGQGPAAPALSVTQPGCLVVQALLTDKKVLSNGVGGLTGHMVCGYQERSDLAMVCSVRQVGDLTGIVDADNLYEFSGSADFVMSALSLKAN